MQRMTLDIEAGQVSAEPAQRGIPAHTRIHVLIEVPDDADLPVTAMAQTGGAFEFPGEGPDLYTDADAIERLRQVLAFGAIALPRFPCTDLSGDKRRPALTVSRNIDRRTDMVVCLTTSIPHSGPDMAVINATPGISLNVRSTVRFDKLATLDNSVITGRFGSAPAEWLAAQKAPSFGVFDFDP
jgi:mRNA interferase MazF